MIDSNERLARAEAEDISHAGALLGNPKIVGTRGKCSVVEGHMRASMLGSGGQALPSVVGARSLWW